MRKNSKRWIWILVLTLLVIWILPKMPFNENVDKRIQAEVFMDGVSERTTEVVIKGKRTRYLFSERQFFFGSFQLKEYPRTQREDMTAEVSWHETFDTERILYSQNATFPELDMERDLIIDENMEHFALGFKDGRIVATSDAWMEMYLEKYGDKN